LTQGPEKSILPVIRASLGDVLKRYSVLPDSNVSNAPTCFARESVNACLTPGPEAAIPVSFDGRPRQLDTAYGRLIVAICFSNLRLAQNS
jgi:hypothetical protein